MSELKSINSQHLYQAVGHAISAWASCEDELANIFGLSVGGVDQRPARRAFWAIQAFESKLRMTDEAASFHLRKDKELKAEWKRIFNRLTDKKQKRNNLAHGTVVHFMRKPLGSDTLEEEHALIPSFGTWKDGSQKRDKEDQGFVPASAMRLDEISLATREFYQIRAELADLGGRMRGAGAPE